jgi:hypothetical protein
MSFEKQVALLKVEQGFEGFFTPEEPTSIIQETNDEPLAEQLMFESVDESLITESISKTADVPMRSHAMAALMSFAEEGMNTAEELDLMAVGMADLDEDGEVTEPEQEDYEESLNAMADAMEHVGLEPDMVESALTGDDDAAEAVALHVADLMDSLDDQDQYIANYSVRENMMLEAVRKVVRNGKVKYIKKPLRKRRMSSAQKAALKKARRKANTGASKRARRKSMSIRKKVGA